VAGGHGAILHLRHQGNAVDSQLVCLRRSTIFRALRLMTIDCFRPKS